MKLTGPEILRCQKLGRIVITPFDQTCLNPNSYNLSLGSKLLVYDRTPKVQRHPDSDNLVYMGEALACQWNHDRLRAKRNGGVAKILPQADARIELAKWDDVLDMKEENPTYELTIPETGLVLIPGRLYLGHTAEYTETHGLVPCIDGRSSIGRLGLSIHATAGFGDVGFCGTWTLEITVVEPVRVYPAVRLCQISYEPVVGEIENYKSNKYQGQIEPRPSGLWKELKRDQSREEGTQPAQAALPVGQDPSES